MKKKMVIGAFELTTSRVQNQRTDKLRITTNFNTFNIREIKNYIKNKKKIKLILVNFHVDSVDVLHLPCENKKNLVGSTRTCESHTRVKITQSGIFSC
jgi:uncharacterized membrane protein